MLNWTVTLIFWFHYFSSQTRLSLLIFLSCKSQNQCNLFPFLHFHHCRSQQVPKSLVSLARGSSAQRANHSSLLRWCSRTWPRTCVWSEPRCLTVTHTADGWCHGSPQWQCLFVCFSLSGLRQVSGGQRVCSYAGLQCGACHAVPGTRNIPQSVAASICS